MYSLYVDVYVPKPWNMAKKPYISSEVSISMIFVGSSTINSLVCMHLVF